MYLHEIQDMRKFLLAKGVLVAGEEWFVPAMQEYWSDKIAIVWTTDDVHFAVNQHHQAVSEEVAQQALQSALDHHDAEYGVTWITLAGCAEPCREMTEFEAEWFDMNGGNDDTRIIDGATYRILEGEKVIAEGLTFDGTLPYYHDVRYDIGIDSFGPSEQSK